MATETRDPVPAGQCAAVRDMLDGLLELTGATAGWVGWYAADGRLTFPAISGSLAQQLLVDREQLRSIWGFAITEGPTLLNDLRLSSTAAIAAVSNLLTCPIRKLDETTGHIVLANKPGGFVSQDATVVQGVSHLLQRELSKGSQVPPDGAIYAKLLDQLDVGLFVVGEDGKLLHVNETWLAWSGFSREELLGQRSPFPFWIDQRDLATAWHLDAPRSSDALPFRCRDNSLFWCQVQTGALESDGRVLTTAILHRVLARPIEYHQAEPAGSEYSRHVVVPVSRPTSVPPAPNWLALLLRPGAAPSYWDERWEHLTGLSAEDVTGVRSELVLDWLFPRQLDRNFVADWLHDAGRHGSQAVLEVLTNTGSRPLLCTLLPIQSADHRKRDSEVPGLLLVGESELFAGPGTPSQGFVRQFARGLGVLLNHYLSRPVAIAETALDQPDLPVQLAASFQQVLESCQKANHLLAALEDLSATTPGDTSLLSLTALVHEAVQERQSQQTAGTIVIEVGRKDDDAVVLANRRMIRSVLGHLFNNAEQALHRERPGRIIVRVSVNEDAVQCEVQDNGEGLPTDDWTEALAPFYSTKGAFARDAAHSEIEATGLGLTVTQHLLALHGGHLELHSLVGGGTRAVLLLPLAKIASPPETATRIDGPASALGPHGRASALEPPKG